MRRFLIWLAHRCLLCHETLRFTSEPFCASCLAKNAILPDWIVDEIKSTVNQ